MPPHGAILSVLTFSVISTHCARILAVFPTPSVSHQIAFRPLTRELAKRGHDVVVITTDPAYTKDNKPANLTEIDIHELSYDSWLKLVPKSESVNDDKEVYKDITGEDNYIDAMKMTYDIINGVAEKQLQHKDVQAMITNKNINYDLLILEAWPRPFLIFSHIYKAPAILISSFSTMVGNYEVVGAPTHPLYTPSGLRLKMYNLTFWEKLRELHVYYALIVNYWLRESYENDMLKGLFGDDIPTLSELSKNVDMLFLNINPIFEGNWPVPPSVVHIGGLQLASRIPQEIPDDLRNFLNSSKNGVIYVSFGTNVSPSSFALEKRQIMLNVFSKLPYDILWKWDGEDLADRPKNIKFFRWCPQPDVLEHRKIKLFITQGGLQSTDEAILAGVPVIGIPFLGDQFFNTEQYLHLKVGLKLKMNTLTEELFMTAIKTVIEDKSYKENMLMLRERILDQPQSSLDKAVWWTEYVLRHGGARHLRTRLVDISWAEYLILDVVLLFVISITIIFTITLYLIKKIYSIFKFRKFKTE